MSWRYILAALLGLTVGGIMLPIYTFVEPYVSIPLLHRKPEWLKNSQIQTEPGRIAWYQSQPEWYRNNRKPLQSPYPPLEQEQRIINKAGDIAFQQGCVDNSMLVPEFAAVFAFGLWTWDRRKRRKESVS